MMMAQRLYEAELHITICVRTPPTWSGCGQRMVRGYIGVVQSVPAG